MNIQHQHTINKMGKIIDRERLTHNQSYKWSSLRTSVNSRIAKEALMPCMYGTCLQRLINRTIPTRRKYPGRRIMASKIDFKPAFRDATYLQQQQCSAAPSCQPKTSSSCT
jgi:hypothetical protein